MDHVLCLIAQPERECLDHGLVTRIAQGLGATPRWLAGDEACEMRIEGREPADSLTRARAEAAERAIDVCALPSGDRIKRLLLCDLDSTIITVESIDELADRAGAKAEVAAITRRAMEGELDFGAALEARVALLAGLPDTIFEEVYRDRVRLMPGARVLLGTMRAKGAIAGLVSGGFVPLAERVQRELRFHHLWANRLEVVAGCLTGRVTPPIVGPHAKLAAFEELCARYRIAAGHTLAVGDGANDLPMLLAAGLGVAFRAHAAVRRAAPVVIEHGDLRALLYLQGIAKDDFVLS
jgi:phosphoserine phosphatase